MQIVIPMSGYGERFRRAGYTVPKPLIPVNGRPIISYVIDLFKDKQGHGAHDWLFICNQEHLAHPDYHLRDTLVLLCKNLSALSVSIVGIAPHRMGPVYAVLSAQQHIKDNQPVIVNYCDFTCDWELSYFLTWIHKHQPDGAIPAYRGFHPHSLGSTHYAYMQEEQGVVSAIQEKKPFTDNPMQEYASSGTYYFKSGAMMKHAFHQTIEQKLNVGGEYYVSLAYRPMLDTHKRVRVYPLNHFMQWGTPQDLKEYLTYSNAFMAMTQQQQPQAAATGTLLMPMMGVGQRFKDAGYPQIKPLICVSGKPMAAQALFDVPLFKRNLFITHSQIQDQHTLTQALQKTIQIKAQHNKQDLPKSDFIFFNTLTKGQADTCLRAINQASVVLDEPLLITACDNGVLFNQADWGSQIQRPEVDILVWCTRAHPMAQKSPTMFGWAMTTPESLRITDVMVKQIPPHPDQDPMIIGTFYFKRAADFVRAAQAMINANDCINGEFYVDQCIHYAILQGLRCDVFEVSHYLSFGTPNELKTFQYWQQCFDAWPHHSYSIDNDPHIDKDSIHTLRSCQ